jgi:CBS domain-containing protein
MKTIGQFLDQSKRPVYSVGPNATVREALELMAKHNIGALLVLDDHLLAGIFSERDYARKVALKDKSSSDARVSEIMTFKVITINTKHTIDECMQIMTDNHIRHLPIVDDQKVIGLISIGDVVREMIGYQKSMIEQLQSYIAGQKFFEVMSLTA